MIDRGRDRVKKNEEIDVQSSHDLQSDLLIHVVVAQEVEADQPNVAIALVGISNSLSFLDAADNLKLSKLRNFAFSLNELHKNLITKKILNIFVKFWN